MNSSAMPGASRFGASLSSFADKLTNCASIGITPHHEQPILLAGTKDRIGKIARVRRLVEQVSFSEQSARKRHNDPQSSYMSLNGYLAKTIQDSEQRHESVPSPSPGRYIPLWLALGAWFVAAVILFAIAFSGSNRGHLVLPGPTPFPEILEVPSAQPTPTPIVLATPTPIILRPAPTPQPLRVLTLPVSGEFRSYVGDYFISSRAAHLEIRTKPGQNYLVRLYRNGSGYRAMDIFMRGGDIRKVVVPRGEFVIKFASGKNWYGYEHLFGEGTRYKQADEIFKFDFGSSWFIALYSTPGGNLGITEISPDEF